jgi:hypothetical protein
LRIVSAGGPGQADPGIRLAPIDRIETRMLDPAMEEASSSIIPVLFGFTLVVVLAIGIYQYFKVKRARREHHHSVSELQERREEAHGGPPR